MQCYFVISFSGWFLYFCFLLFHCSSKTAFCHKMYPSILVFQICISIKYFQYTFIFENPCKWFSKQYINQTSLWNENRDVLYIKVFSLVEWEALYLKQIKKQEICSFRNILLFDLFLIFYCLYAFNLLFITQILVHFAIFTAPKRIYFLQNSIQRRTEKQ